MTYTIIFSPKQSAYHAKLASNRAKYWNNQPDSYGSYNTFAYHFVGAAGELALIEHCLNTNHSFISNYQEPASTKPDIIINNQPYEIKTWKREHWIDLGRCIKPNHLHNYQDRTAIIWCILEPDNKTISIEGYNTIQEIQAKPIIKTGWRRISNHQIPLGEMHKIEEIIT